MALTKEDFAILDEFQFEIQPVGVKYLTKPPDGIRALEERMTLCEMLKKAQGEVFLRRAPRPRVRRRTLCPGPDGFGGTVHQRGIWFRTGVFCDARAAAGSTTIFPKIARGVVNYVAFSGLDKLAFDPDVLILLATTGSDRNHLEGHELQDRKPWVSRYSAAIGCAWLFIIPTWKGRSISSQPVSASA